MQAIKLTPPLVPPALCTLGFLACFHSLPSASSKAGNNQAVHPQDRMLFLSLPQQMGALRWGAFVPLHPAGREGEWHRMWHFAQELAVSQVQCCQMFVAKGTTTLRLGASPTSLPWSGLDHCSARRVQQE